MKKIILFILIISAVALFVGCNQATEDMDTEITEPSGEPQVCTKEYIPVCGVDNNTYSNKCMAGDVKIAFEGECELAELKACTMEYAPVCGTDGVTYGNSCIAGKTEIAYEGEC